MQGLEARTVERGVSSLFAGLFVELELFDHLDVLALVGHQNRPPFRELGDDGLLGGQVQLVRLPVGGRDTLLG